MSMIQFRRTAAAAAGLAIIGGGILGAGVASAGGDTTAPKPGELICGTTGINGEPQKIVPCPPLPTTGPSVTLDSDGTIRDESGKVIGRFDPKTGKVTGVAPGTPARTGGAVTGGTTR